jgi:hypothetical protein
VTIDARNCVLFDTLLSVVNLRAGACRPRLN